MVWSRIFIDFDVIGTLFCKLFGHRSSKFQFRFGLVSRSRFVLISEVKCRRLELLTPGFGMEGIAKTHSHRNHVFIHFCIEFSDLLEAMGAFVLVVVALQASLKNNGFGCFFKGRAPGSQVG